MPDSVVFMLAYCAFICWIWLVVKASRRG